MPRAIGKAASHARRKKIIRMAKGYFGRRSKLLRSAREAVYHALQYSYRDRRARRRDFRRLWIIRINAAARMLGTTYAQLIARLKQTGVEINRPMLAELAARDFAAFEAVVKSAMESTPPKVSAE